MDKESGQGIGDLPKTAVPAPACTFVIFGATGDLTKRLLMPALYNLSGGKLLDDKFQVLGVGRAGGNDAEFQTNQTESMEEFVASKKSKSGTKELNSTSWGWLKERLHYMTGDFDKPETYAEIGKRIGEGNAVFYLAVPDQMFAGIIDNLHAAKLTEQKDDVFRRVIIEKPFGHDLPSAVELNRHILETLKEDQIYRIDHFLGKETVQNIMALRFGNGIFEPLWNRDHIDSVQITAAETVGVEQRGSFYESTGALRDMVPNHLFQLLAMVAMEPPKSFHADDVRSEKSKLIATIRPLTEEDVETHVVLGQYDAGHLPKGDVPAYIDEPNVAKDSKVETYVAAKMLIDNWRWAGVPFYLRTGKRLARRNTEIVIQFKPAPMAAFRDTPTDALPANIMVLHLQPDEGISLLFNAKRPGQAVVLDGVRMDFRYDDFFDLKPSTGYETLIYDVLIGDPTLFNRADNIEAGWQGVQPILDVEKAGKTKLHRYTAGSNGPAAADELLDTRGSQLAEARLILPVRLVVSDVDGTIVTNDKTLLPGTIAAASRLKDAGISLALVSARPPRAIAPLLAPLHIAGPVAAFNGGTILSDGVLIFESPVPEEAVRVAIDFFARKNITVWLFADDQWIIQNPQGDHVALERITVGFDPTVVEDFTPYLARCGKVVGVSNDFALLESCESELDSLLNSLAIAHRSQKYYLDITHPQANKGGALRAIAALYGMDLSAVAAIGDMANDIPMLEIAGFSIAMGNAPPNVAAVAKVQTGPNTGSGWADAIDRYILSDEGVLK